MIKLNSAEAHMLAIILTDVLNGDLIGADDLRYDKQRINALVQSLYDQGVDSEAMFERSDRFILPYERTPNAVWSSGWNIPGYLPDVEPLNFPTFTAAKDALIEALEQARDDYPESLRQQALYRAAIAEVRGQPDDQDFWLRVGNYVWWVQRIVLPEGSEA